MVRAARRRMRGRKKWMAFNPRDRGRHRRGRGAEKAIVKQGRSLLPAGVKGVRGQLPMGSVISILDEEGHEVARGLCNFSSEELERIKGLNTSRITQVLGAEASFDEVVHRDNLVVVARGIEMSDLVLVVGLAARPARRPPVGCGAERGHEERRVASHGTAIHRERGPIKAANARDLEGGRTAGLPPAPCWIGSR